MVEQRRITYLNGAAAAEKLRRAALPDIMEKAIQQALKGDSKCLHMLLEPEIGKFSPFEYELGEVGTAQEGKRALQHILKGLSSGQLRTHEAVALQESVKGIMESIHLVDHEIKLAELEGKVGLQAETQLSLDAL